MAKRKIAQITPHETKFGRLAVVAPAEPFMWKGKRHGAQWKCVCDCGAETVQRQCHLVTGRVVSCGCHRDEMTAVRNRKRDPALLWTPEYVAWGNMLSRCRNPNNPAWEHYGGKGITVCQQWQDSFDQFFADVGLRPSARYSLDRIDGTKGYEPGNVRWATLSEQARNKPFRRYLFNGKKACLADIADASKLPKSLIKHRLSRGLDPDEAVSRPRMKNQFG